MSWPLASLLIVALALAGGFAWYERSRPPAKMVALVAALAGMAALGRIAFAPLPNVKPTTDIVLIAGFALGGSPGFAVGALAALTSNFFFLQGPWTPWQMAAWGGVGLAGAGLGRLCAGRPGRGLLAGSCALAGLGFGAVMNLFTFSYQATHSLAAYGAVAAQALPFDLAHALGNVAFALLFGPALAAALMRFRARLEVTWKPPPPAGAVLALVVGMLAVASVAYPASARAATPATYLRGAQNADGGFGSARGGSSGQLFSGWAALGLAAGGQNPLDVRRPGGRSVIDFMRAGARALNDTGELERTILVLSAAGVSPRSFAGRNLVGALDARRSANGSFGNQVNLTAFALMALRSTGRSSGALGSSTRWLAAQHNPDGGFNFAGRGGASGIDDTAAALEGLAAGGAGRAPAASGGARFLAARQNRDGGFPLVPGQSSNAQSTAFAVQGLIAAGRSPDALHRLGAPSPLTYLRSLTATSGLVRYSRSSSQTPVWVTGQVLAALARKPLPLRRVARRATAAASAAGGRGKPRARAAAARARKGARTPAALATSREGVLVMARTAGVAMGWLMEPIR